MKVLGIGLSHCAGVCLIEDGRIIFAQEEDRFSRIRRHKGWPEQSLKYLFEKYHLTESDIDLCVLCDLQTAKLLGKRIQAKKTVALHHHLAHVMSGWALSPWDSFDAVSLDGGGDYGSWLSFGRVRDNKLIQWESNCGFRFSCHSPTRVPAFAGINSGGNPVKRGILNFKKPGRPFGSYWSIPAVVNFGMVDKSGIGGYEGKLMGLAAHGKAHLFDPKQASYDGTFRMKQTSSFHYIETKGHPKIGDKKYCVTSDGQRLTLQDVRRLRKKEKFIVCEYDLQKKEHLQWASNFAAYLQDKTNKIILELFERNFNSDMPIVVSGGTFSNVLTNGILNQKYSLFVTPPMGDDGLALGAAAWGAYISGMGKPEWPGLYLGYDAGSNDSVNPSTVAELLANKKTVGLIEGRMELGPRALGGRSILSDAQDNHVNWTINERLDRVEYMPFAPVILEEFAHDVLVGWKKEHLSSKHMTLVYQVNPRWKQKIQGVVHVDGTVRPQVINRSDNPFYYAIVYEYYKTTGIPVLINTSFNAHGEPILRTVEEGIHALKSNRVDVLIARNEIMYG